MSESNKSFRIKTTVNDGNPSLMVNLDQSYSTFEILSLKMNQNDIYKLNSANYGVIVGRVLANGNFGVPNAKISIFIEGNFENEEIASIYPYTSTANENSNGVKYNLLPDEKVDNCHQVVGTFPNKTYLLDNDVLVEVFDTYYKYTTRTNNSGDYIIAGVPTGNQTLHMDLDLSDCGILSQRPRDFVYKGYTIEQFENPNQFKKDTNLDALSQIFSQDQVVNVIPFWGNENQGETIGITRADIEIAFKFEPTCVFMGSVVADNASNGISKKCVPTNQMGAMDELTTGEGTIEMIRYTQGGDIEEFQIKGTELIDGNGVWCYQIPMNLDYMMTDEYGNMVPTDDPNKGIPTRTRVRFRISMQDMEKNTDNYFRAKVLVPHNPQNISGTGSTHEDYDYEFGSKTREDSFRDLLWNNVYTVKSYIPRFQKSKTSRDTQRFTGIKHCNYYGNNNPMPYNNIRIKLPLMFTILCALIKTYIRIVYIINNILNTIVSTLQDILNAVEDILVVVVTWVITTLTAGANWLFKLFGGDETFGIKDSIFGLSDRVMYSFKRWRYLTIADGLCPDLENWYFAPVKKNFVSDGETINLLQQTFDFLVGDETQDIKSEDYYPPVKDEKNALPIDYNNSDDIDNSKPLEEQSPQSVCITIWTDYLIACIEMALAQEYRVINFDFYNDWVNGVIYMPRWMRFVRAKRTFLFGLIKIKSKVKACMDNTSIFNKTRYYTQQCSLTYGYNSSNSGFTNIETSNGCVPNSPKKQKCHKKGNKNYPIFGGSKNASVNGNGGIVHENETIKKEYVYYLKPCEWTIGTGKKVNLFANDIVLLGSLLDCNLYGIPQAFKYLTSSSYIMPTNLALTNMDDEGYLYADGNGTICSKQNEPNTEDTVTRTGNTFSSESNYWGDLEYGEYDDTIPMTEAAGIAWNYTGPGQGSASTNVKESLYMPGGHFLGISCTNSETNIKSCVNLERICEIGSNMSQRREEVRMVDGESRSLKYTYFVPSGLIANDEVNGGTFRSMFATMNHKRLLCTDKVDEKTGYPIYDFMYLRTNGFDGGLKKKISGDTWNTQWNTQIDIIDELSSFPNVSKDVNYDDEESANTYVRTIEEAKMDYYQFRLGLDTLTDKNEQYKKFLVQEGSSVRLPQYENSFYFYFGLKDGATAFDEFLKQFFSTCDDSTVLKNRMDVKKTRDDADECSFTSDITIEGTGVFGFVTGYYEHVDANGQKQKSEDKTIQSINGTFSVVVHDLPFGEYTFTFTDELDNNVTRKFNVGNNIVNGSFGSKNFEFRTSGMTSEAIVEKARTLDCGYVLLNSLSYFNSAYTAMEGWEEIKDYLVIVAGDKSYFGRRGDVLPDGITGTSINANVLGNDGKMYVWKADATYDIYMTSMNGEECEGYVYLGSLYVEGIDNYDLYLGSKLLPYSRELSGYTGEWWLNIGDDTQDIKNWAKRYALFKRIDNSGETYTNKVIAIDSRNRVIDTALFGEPERNNELYGMVRYENDNIGNWELSDTSVIPTTLSTTSTLPDWSRNLFGEMAINGNAIISDKITDVNADFHEGENNRNYFTAIISDNKLKDKHGCIAKLEDGRILYCIKDGDNYYFEDNLPDESPAVVSVYPVFYYPVIYRPFYTNTSIVLWGNKSYSESIGSEGETIYMIGYNQDKYNGAISIKNGLTYQRYFDYVTFNDNNITALTRYEDTSGLTSDYCYSSRTSDRVTLQIVSNTGSSEDEKFNYFSYGVKEKGPSSAETSYSALTTPNPIKLLTVSDRIDTQGANSISWRADKTGSSYDVYQFTNDINDTSSSEKKYYLINGNTLPNPLINNVYISTNINGSTSDKLYLFKFTEDADEILDVENTGITYVNVPNSPVDVTISSERTASFAYISSNATNIILRKTITGNSFTDLITKLQSSGGVVPVMSYQWNGNIYNDDINNNIAGSETFINGLINLPDSDKKIIFSGNNSYTISESFKEKAYVVFIRENRIGENGSTILVKVYPEIIDITDYSGEGEEPYLELIPDGTNGIYDSFSYNLTVNGAVYPEKIDSTVTSFNIQTAPTTSDTYSIKVNTDVVANNISGNYNRGYDCGANTETRERTFTVVAYNNDREETVIITQKGQEEKYFKWSNGSSENAYEASSGAGNATLNYTSNYEDLSFEPNNVIVTNVTKNDNNIVIYWDENISTSDTPGGRVTVKSGGDDVGVLYVSQKGKAYFEWAADSSTARTIQIEYNTTSSTVYYNTNYDNLLFEVDNYVVTAYTNNVVKTLANQTSDLHTGSVTVKYNNITVGVLTVEQSGKPAPTSRGIIIGAGGAWSLTLNHTGAQYNPSHWDFKLSLSGESTEENMFKGDVEITDMDFQQKEDFNMVGEIKFSATTMEAFSADVKLVITLDYGEGNCYVNVDGNNPYGFVSNTPISQYEQLVIYGKIGIPAGTAGVVTNLTLENIDWVTRNIVP